MTVTLGQTTSYGVPVTQASFLPSTSFYLGAGVAVLNFRNEREVSLSTTALTLVVVAIITRAITPGRTRIRRTP